MKKISSFFLYLCAILFLFPFCKTSNANFITNSNLDYHKFSIQENRIQPIVILSAQNPQGEQKLTELSFVIDTGSNISLIKKNLFTHSGQKKIFRLKSISGETEKESIEINLNLFDKNNNLILANSVFHSLDISSRFDFDGIIGNDVLENFDLFIELPDNIFLLKPTYTKKNLEGFKKIPLLLSEGHIIFQIKIKSIPCRLLFDTGAGISYLKTQKAKELNLKIGGQASFLDLEGNQIDTIYHIGENLCVDENICQKKIDLLSGNSIKDFLSNEENLDGILGQNWISQYSILIDYRNKSLYIKQR